MKPNLTKLVPSLIAGAVVALVCIVKLVHQSNPKFDHAEQLEWITYDWRVKQSFRFPQPVATNLGAVFIDDDSVVEINRKHGFIFPWPRQLYARMVNELKAQGARAVGLDIFFSERHPERAVNIEGRGLVFSDDYFAEEMRKAGNV
ncbi:MAG: CHASE2 domain-containing protein, partial [Verrucomicrobiota bacterium]